MNSLENSNDELDLLRNSLVTYFDESVLKVTGGEQQLEEALSREIVFMLLHKMEALLGVLYRLDVNEKEVKHVFAAMHPGKIAPAIARLIINRQKEKLESRKKYKDRS